MPHRHLAALLGIAALAPSTAAQTISVDAPVTASFTAGDPRRSGDKPYRIYWYTATGGERLVVQMTSTSMDPYLMVGRRPSPSATRVEDLVDVAQDDDGGAGLNAALEYTFRTPGVYGIVATVVERSPSGTFELSLSRATGGASENVQFARLNESYQARLDASKPEADGRRYALYFYRATRGESVVATMRSTDFDAYLEVGGPITETPTNTTSFGTLASDDDGGSDMDARLEFTFPSDGVYAFRARSFRRGVTGNFTFRIDRSTDPQANRTEARRATRPGETTAPAPRPSTPPAPRRLTLDEAVARVLSDSRAQGYSLAFGDRQLFNSRASRTLELTDLRAGEEVLVVMVEENGDTGGWVRLTLRSPGRAERQLESPTVIESRDLPGVLLSGAQVRVPSGTPAGSVLGIEMRARYYTSVAAPVHMLVFVRR